METTYKRLTAEDREVISQMLIQQYSCSAIARVLQKHRSAITREVSSGVYHAGKYSAVRSHRKALKRASSRHQKRKLDDPVLWKFVCEKLTLRWSPEQIAQELKECYPKQPSMQVSHESIYSYIYLLPKGSLKKELIRYLRQHKKKRKSRPQASNDRRGSIPNMISIEERPAEVAHRSVPGHWEGDLLMGKRHASALGSVVERTTRTVILVPLKAKDAASVRKSFARELKTLPKQMRLSMTYDRGKEMAEHELFTKSTKMQVYFCHPQSPWERGTNENTNMLIRQFFPKGTDFTKVTRREIKYVQKLLNERPRKALGFATPKEAFNLLVGSVALKT
jgi:IS30 family transposase